MLLEDGGRPLRELIAVERSLDRWASVLPLYASVQIGVSGDVAEILALGVPDLRLEVLPAKIEAMLDEVVDLPDDERRRLVESMLWVREACEELAAAGVRRQSRHDGLHHHDAHLMPRRGRYRLPRLGRCLRLAPVLEPRGDAGRRHFLAGSRRCARAQHPTEPFRDAYLESFRGHTSSDLIALSTTCSPAGMVVSCRQQSPLPAVGREHATASPHVPGRSRVA